MCVLFVIIFYNLYICIFVHIIHNYLCKNFECTFLKFLHLVTKFLLLFLFVLLLSTLFTVYG